MKRVELKRIAEFLWKGTPADEKTPFAAQGTLPDNGSFSKNFDSEDNKKAAKEFPEDEDEKAEGPMSIPRKICFLMSFNVWVLYFLVLGWLLPCRNPECGLPLPDMVETNLSNILRLTNVETMNFKGLQSLAFLGYDDDGLEWKLSALATFDGTIEWTNRLRFIPRKIQCNFQNIFDVNGDGIPDCLLSGYSDVYAFNVSNGYVFWHQSRPSEEGDILSGFHPSTVSNNSNYLIGTCGDTMVILNARNGNKTSEIMLPCSSPIEIRIVPFIVGSNSTTLWSIVCYYGDKVEAWGFGERDLLNGGNLENKANASEFALLYSGSNSGGSIGLGCDVTPIPGGPLLLSWSGRVAMVTPEATAWERHFPYPLTVASIKVGHFSSPKEMLVAAAMRNESNTIIVMMEMKNGSVVDSVVLENRQAQSMEKFPGDVDYLVLKSLVPNNYSLPVFNFSDPIPMDGTNFVVIDFRSGNFKIKDIVTTSRVTDEGSTLNIQENGETDLLIIKTEDGNTSYQKHVIHGSDAENILCHGVKKMTHYSFET